LVIVPLTEEKRGRMPNAGRERGEKEGRDAGHLISQFLVVIQKQHIENISRMKGAADGKN
jgi:hypothetical protein